MIIAEIGHKKFVLQNVADAETLLRILSTSKQIDDTYIDGQWIYHDDYSTSTLNISIKKDMEILTYDDAMKLKADKENKKE